MIPLQSQPIPKQLKRMIEWVGNSSRPLDGVSTSGAGSARVWTTALYLLVRTGHFPTTLLGVQAVTITSLPNIFLSHSLIHSKTPFLVSAVPCSDYSFLQQGLASQIPHVRARAWGDLGRFYFFQMTGLCKWELSQSSRQSWRQLHLQSSSI